MVLFVENSHSRKHGERLHTKTRDNTQLSSAFPTLTATTATNTKTLSYLKTTNCAKCACVKQPRVKQLKVFQGAPVNIY